MRQSWGELIHTYLHQAPQLVGLVLLLDCRRTPSREDQELLSWLSFRRLPTMAAVTKIDKLNRDKTKRKLSAVETELGIPAIGFSSITGTGKKELVASIHQLVNEHFEKQEN